MWCAKELCGDLLRKGSDGVDACDILGDVEGSNAKIQG